MERVYITPVSPATTRVDYVDDRMLDQFLLEFSCFIKEALEANPLHLKEQIEIIRKRIGYMDRCIRIFRIIPIIDDIFSKTLEQLVESRNVFLAHCVAIEDLYRDNEIMKIMKKDLYRDNEIMEITKKDMKTFLDKVPITK